jgi:hypothetical protein
MKYEGNIGNYSFIMNEDDIIEVWSDMDMEQPETYIFVKSGSIKDKKAFDAEISFWWMEKNR